MYRHYIKFFFKIKQNENDSFTQQYRPQSEVFRAIDFFLGRLSNAKIDYIHRNHNPVRSQP